MSYEQDHRDRMFATVQRLLADSPKLDTDNKPALECQIILKSGQPLAGVLSVCDDGVGLRMGAMTQMKGHHTPVLVETFFDYDEIAAISVARKVSLTAPEAPPIIHTT